MKRPALPLPDALRGEEPGSFAHYTITTRLPSLARLALAENDFPSQVVAKLEALIAEIPHGAIRPLQDASAPDAADWERYIQPYLGQTWLQAPWFFIEAYFFRRILEATGYFQEGPGKDADPYLHEKKTGLEMSRQAIRDLATLSMRADAGQGWPSDLFFILLYADLWGNQADLSMWPAHERARPRHESARQAQEHLLIDDSRAVVEALSAPGNGAQSAQRIDFLVDNAGFELVCDLLLADLLLRMDERNRVCLHLKAHPTYVSDATAPDVRNAIAFLGADPSPGCQSAAARLEQALAEQRLELRPDFFWCSPLPAWEMPPRVYQSLAQARLAICKGDANYRRLVGDRRWPIDTPLAQIMTYFPTSLLALRIFKSEVALDLQADQAKAVQRADPGWMTNGRWGIVRFLAKNSSDHRKTG